MAKNALTSEVVFILSGLNREILLYTCTVASTLYLFAHKNKVYKVYNSQSTK